MRTLVVAALVCGLAGRAAASVASCAGLADGTPCTDQCVVAGHCAAEVCVADRSAPDGTPCSSGNRCSLGDVCQAGVCTAGGTQRSCPSVDRCNVGVCLPDVGCAVTFVCIDGGSGDGGTTHYDGGTTHYDGGGVHYDGGGVHYDGGAVHYDGGGVHYDGGGVHYDGGTMPDGGAPGGDLASGATPDLSRGGTAPPPDAAGVGDLGSAAPVTPPKSANAVERVLGSSVGGCSAAGGARTGDSALVLLALLVAATARRGRRLTGAARVR